MRSYYLFTLLLGLLVVQKSLAQSFQNHAEIRNKKGTPALFINGQEIPPFAYLSYLGKPEYYREMKDAGIEIRSEEHTSELQSRENLVCRLLLEKKKKPQNYQLALSHGGSAP